MPKSIVGSHIGRSFLTLDRSGSRDSWLGFVFGVIFLNSILFSAGHLVLGSYTTALILIGTGGISGWLTLELVATAKTQEHP